MPTLVAVALLLAVAPQLPENRVRSEETSARPRSNVVHGSGGRLVLPSSPGEDRRRSAAQPQDPIRGGGAGGAFEGAVKDLRRSLFVPESKEQAILQQIGRTYDRIPERCLALVRSADPDVVHGLMRVLRAYGAPEHARELEFQLLTRPFRASTRIVVDTMAVIARDEANDRLFSCLTASRSTVRHHAAEALSDRVRPEDVDRLVVLSQQASTDVQIKALRLLGAAPASAPVRARLLAALSDEARLASAAVEALIQQGAGSAADLQEVLRRPALSRETGYASLVLAALEDAEPGTVLITDDMAPHLVAELDVPDPFQRGAVAIALAGLAWRSDDSTGEPYSDKRIVGALLEVVAPTEFVSHLATLSRLARPRLVLLTGRDLGAAQGAWRAWWTEVGAAAGFVGARRHVALTVDNAEFATMTWTGSERTVVLRGERTRAVGDRDARQFVLSADQLAGLVAELERLGFMGVPPRGRGDADPRSLSLTVSGVVVRSDPMTAAAILDRIGSRIDAIAGGNRWQLYRDPAGQPDPVAFWRAERRWLEQNPDPVARTGRLKGRILRVLPQLDPVRVQEALDDLIAIPDLRDLLTEEDGLALVEAARAAESWDGRTFRILELALLAPGEAVWPELVEVARLRDEAEGAAGVALRRIFALAGPDRVLAALDTESELVRRVAMDEIASLEDIRAVPKLIVTARDGDQSVDLRRTAVHALGKLGVFDARAPLIAMLDDDLLDPGLRRTTWIALARIGGEEVFPVLQRAFPSPEDADRRAVIQALGAMHHPKAARELASIFALRGSDTLGTLALDQLRQMGDLLASPALIPQLNGRNDQVRRQCAMLLGEFQNPAALGELFVMLSEDDGRLRVIALIAGITGQNVTDRDDRAEHLRSWYAANGSQAQGDWLLLALDESKIAHSLQREQVDANAGVGAIPELTRIVMESEQPWIRSLAGRILRLATGQDYGTVSALASEPQRLAICERYRLLHNSSQAASGR